MSLIQLVPNKRKGIFFLLITRRAFQNSSASAGLREKQQQQRDFVVPGSAPLPRAVSYEDFRKHRESHLSSKRSMDSSSNIKKAKSDTDVAMLSLKKKVDVSAVDCIGGYC